jgi:hypothetical protein
MHKQITRGRFVTCTALAVVLLGARRRRGGIYGRAKPFLRYPRGGVFSS